ncbi:Uncharacterised protein [Mycobacteroides abscessus]|nr:Uncharacterised protein [Mycobacteroides abscessus]
MLDNLFRIRFEVIAGDTVCVLPRPKARVPASGWVTTVPSASTAVTSSGL